MCEAQWLEHTIDPKYQVIRTNCCPPQRMRNETKHFKTHIPISQDIVFHLPLIPTISSDNVLLKELQVIGIIGVSVHGIPFYSNFGKAGENLLLHEKSTLDLCGGHASGSGIYHYHTDPVCMYHDTPGMHSPLLGFMLDGIPIYGKQDHGGKVPTNLDGCNGHIDNKQKIYHYHLTSTFPYHVNCFKGC